MSAMAMVWNSKHKTANLHCGVGVCEPACRKLNPYCGAGEPIMQVREVAEMVRSTHCNHSAAFDNVEPKSWHWQPQCITVWSCLCWPRENPDNGWLTLTRALDELDILII